MGVLENIRGKAKALADVAGIEAPEDRATRLQTELDAATRTLVDSRSDLELAHLELEEGAADRIAAAEATLEQAEKDFNRARRAREAARTVSERRQVEKAKKDRAAAWRRAEDLAGERIVAASKLAECLRAAGEHYQTVIRLGLDIYSVIPAGAQWQGGPSAYKLSEGDAAAVLGIELQRYGLPQASRIPASMVSGYPTLAQIAESTVASIRQQCGEDAGGAA